MYYRWNQYVVWEKAGQDIIVLDVEDMKNSIRISGEMADFWEKCNGANEFTSSETGKGNIRFLIEKNWVTAAVDPQPINRREISMDEETQIGPGVFFHPRYGALNSIYDKMHTGENEIKLLRAINKHGRIKLSKLFEELNFSDATRFKLLIRRLYKTSLIKVVDDFEEQLIKDKKFRIQFDITQNCNLKCKHCYDHRKVISAVRDDRDTLIKIAGKILDTAELTKCKLDIALSGGEPFSSPFLWDILNEFYKREHLIERLIILSNGTLINERILNQLKQYHFIKAIQISFDGITEEIHDGIRGEGVFIKALHAVGLIKENRGLGVAMHFVVHKGNLQEAYKILDFGNKYEFNRVTITRLVPEGNANDIVDMMLSPAETKELFHYLTERYNSEKKDGLRQTKLAVERCDWPLVFNEGEKCTPEYNGYHCQVGKLNLDVRENGDVYPCRRLPIKIGNILQDDIHDLMNHELLWQFRRKTDLGLMKGKCSSCDFATNPQKKHMCSGGAACIAYGVSGDPFMPDPQCVLIEN